MTDVRLSIAVMAHHSRAERAIELARSLDAFVVMDADAHGTWPTAQRAWMAHDPQATHHIVLQDDAEPIPDFRKHAADAIAAKPTAIISFYLGTGAPKQVQPDILRAAAQARHEKAAWIQVYFLSAVALAAPVREIPHLLRVGNPKDADVDPKFIPDDLTLYHSANALGMPILATWPSLVDHADEPSVVAAQYGAKPPRRKAHLVGVPERWDTGAVPL